MVTASLCGSAACRRASPAAVYHYPRRSIWALKSTFFWRAGVVMDPLRSRMICILNLPWATVTPDQLVWGRATVSHPHMLRWKIWSSMFKISGKPGVSIVYRGHRRSQRPSKAPGPYPGRCRLLAHGRFGLGPALSGTLPAMSALTRAWLGLGLLSVGRAEK